MNSNERPSRMLDDFVQPNHTQYNYIEPMPQLLNKRPGNDQD